MYVGMTPNWKHFLTLSGLILLLFVTCEYIIYYVVITHCSWPKLTRDAVLDETPLHAIFLADPHLLGSRNGHWFDKLRREWQMERSFQSAVTLFAPEAVFVLGDLMDEGKWSSDEEFSATVSRFQKIFHQGRTGQTHVIMGNHDIGFHYRTNQHLIDRFERNFDVSAVNVINIRDIIFVTVNSVAMENDHCPVCSEAAYRLTEVSKQLNCTRFGTATGKKGGEKLCNNYEKLPNVQPILLQHYPLFRKNDADCTGVDSAPPEEKYKEFKPNWDTVSKESSNKLLSYIQPRLVLSGHIHHGCYVVHNEKTAEISIPSFSWRNRNNPSFIMMTITSSEYVFSKCFLPEESSVIQMYFIGGICIILWIAYTRNNFFTRSFRKYKK
ncbi:metallophosphoesterase 1-like [Antedon mediterranea]|uniref:metallophosphoesterase 1-like n=1 Tax=Antedon mediterranea TaxID=105859 RepID=UPI003AF9CEEC